jgi:hypothetical protein
MFVGGGGGSIWVRGRGDHTLTPQADKFATGANDTSGKYSYNQCCGSGIFIPDPGS